MRKLLFLIGLMFFFFIIVRCSGGSPLDGTWQYKLRDGSNEKLIIKGSKYCIDLGGWTGGPDGLAELGRWEQEANTSRMILIAEPRYNRTRAMHCTLTTPDTLDCGIDGQFNHLKSWDSKILLPL